MKKKLLAISVIVAVAALLVGGSTFALFTDTASNSETIFTTGTLDINSYRDGFDTIPGPMFYTTPEEGATPTDPSYLGIKPTGEWVPGMAVIRSLVVYNQGTLETLIDGVKAVVESDTSNMAEVMNVEVYKVFPKCLDGAPFVPLPGDETLNGEELDAATEAVNWFITNWHWTPQAVGFTDACIEAGVNCYPILMWEGTLDELCSGDFETMDNPVPLKPLNTPLLKHGCLLAFVVTMDLDAGNDYQGADSKFSFVVRGSQDSSI